MSWALLLAPAAEGHTSKAGESDDPVLIDSSDLPWLDKVHAELAAEHMLDRVWAEDTVEYNKIFHRAAELSGVAALKPHPYSLRHSGASDNILRNRRSLA